MNNLDKLTAADLRRAADISDEIEELKSELAQILSGKKKPGRKPGRKPGKKRAGAKPGPKPGGAKKKTAKKKRAKRKMSAAGREAIRAAQKARWAKAKKGK